MLRHKQDKRRTQVPEKPNKPMSLWSVMKNFIGADITKISMPVNFSEPLSMLQRLAEIFDYSNVLDEAAKLGDDLQLAYVAAFAISSYSTTYDRTNKPFNPLLGETYECDRSYDLGWRYLAEQVSHHPPISATFCEGKEWVAWQNFSMTSKFRGKYLRIYPEGLCHLMFNQSRNHYTWDSVVTTVHNIILGKLWVEVTGTMTIKNHTNGWKGVVEFLPYSYFNRDEQRSIKGMIQNELGEVKCMLTGTYDSKIFLSIVHNVIDAKGNKPIYKTDSKSLLWQRRPLVGNAEKYYNFTLLASQLNQLENGVAPTDSRNRPDQRLMEDGQWDEANVVKTTLEERQRERKLSKRKHNIPLWFELNMDPLSGTKIYTYSGKYWKCKEKQTWSGCPNIYNLT